MDELDEQRVLEFIYLITKNSGGLYAPQRLKQLLDIMKEQGAPKQICDRISDAIADSPELIKAAAEAESLTREDLEVAHRRANERRERERGSALRSRC